MKQLRHLQEHINRTKQKEKKLFLMFDYDGVLAPIQKKPDTAFIPTETKKNLLKLLNMKNIKIAIVTGRTLETISRLLSIKSKDLLIIGSHGFEMLDKGRLRFLSKINQRTLSDIKVELLPALKSEINGFLECKPYTFTYHIRENRKGEWVKKAQSISKRFLKRKKLDDNLTVLTGKNIIEVLSKDVSKGVAVEKIISKFSKHHYVYIGDDVTDISAFKIVKKFKGASVSVNKKLNYKADFYLKDTKEVHSLIKCIIGIYA